jgi:hypothetical protein
MVYDIVGDFANAGVFVGMIPGKFIVSIEQLREPHHDSVITDVEGEIDSDRDEGELEDRRNEQLFAGLRDADHHFLELVDKSDRFCGCGQFSLQLLVDQYLFDRVQVLGFARVGHKNAAENGQRAITLAP